MICILLMVFNGNKCILRCSKAIRLQNAKRHAAFSKCISDHRSERDLSQWEDSGEMGGLGGNNRKKWLVALQMQDCDKDIVYRATQTRPIGTQWCTEITDSQGRTVWWVLTASEFLEVAIIYLNCPLIGLTEKRRNKEKKSEKKPKQENRRSMPSPHYFPSWQMPKLSLFSEWVITHHTKTQSFKHTITFCGDLKQIARENIHL